MKTLASFLFLAVLLVAAIRAQQWRRNVLDEADAIRTELRAELDTLKSRFEGYWPRYERLEDALGVASNSLVRLRTELGAERTANDPLREQVEALSAERIAQATREQELRKTLKAAQTEAQQLKGSVEDVRARQAQAEALRQTLEEKVKALEEGLRSRDSDLAQLRERHDRQTAEFGRLQEANKVVPELQNQLAAAKTERDAALAERDQLRKERDAALAERDQARKERDAALAERDQARKERDAATAPPPVGNPPAQPPATP